MTKIIGIDVDGVVADMLPAWVDRYNREYDDHLNYLDIDEWDLIPFVKPECGKNIYKYISDPTLYDDVEEMDDALHGVEQLRFLGFRVVFITSTPVGCSGRKYQWLNDCGFNVKLEDYYEALDKSLLATDYLIDDRDVNVETAYGKGIIYSAPYNRYLEGYKRVNNWIDIVEYFCYVKNKEILDG